MPGAVSTCTCLYACMPPACTQCSHMCQVYLRINVCMHRYTRMSPCVQLQTYIGAVRYVCMASAVYSGNTSSCKQRRGAPNYCPISTRKGTCSQLFILHPVYPTSQAPGDIQTLDRVPTKSIHKFPLPCLRKSGTLNPDPPPLHKAPYFKNPRF